MVRNIFDNGLSDTEGAEDSHRAENDDEVICRIYRDDLYIIDAASGYSVLSSRASSGRKTDGSRFTELLNARRRDIMKKYMTSFDSRPLLIKTSLGYAFVINGIFPSSLLGVVIIPHTDKETFVSLASRGLFDDCIAGHEEFPIGNDKPLTDSEQIHIATINSTFDRFKPCLIDFVQNMGHDYSNSDFGLILKKQIYRLSALCGCPVTLECDGEPEFRRNFDYQIFTAYLMLSMLGARQVAPDRKIYVKLENLKAGPCVSVRFASMPHLTEPLPRELVVLINIADRLNIIFEYLIKEDSVFMRLCPVRKDWSLYELKSSVPFEWDSSTQNPTKTEL